MLSLVWRRPAVAVLLALGVSLTLSATTLAATWSQPKALTTSANVEAGGLAVLGSGKAIVVYVDGGAIKTRRTTDSGVSWKAPVGVTTGRSPVISGSAANVDVAFVRKGLVRYAHSTNGGRTFSTPISLGAASRCVGGGYYCDAATVSVARGPNGVVVVGWLNGAEDAVARVSTNNGSSFAPEKVLVDSVDDPADVFVTAGTGVLYAALVAGPWDDHSLVVARSLDNGATWTDPDPIDSLASSDRYFGGIAMTAVGTRAYIAYLATDTEETVEWVRYIRSIDSGATWSAPVDLSSMTDYRVTDPQIALRNGVVRIVFNREETCCGLHPFYRQSSNGTTWSTGQYVPPAVGDSSTLQIAGVGFAGKVIVFYSFGDAYVNVRV